MSPCMGLIDICIAKPCHNITRPKHNLQQNCPYFEAKLSNFVAVSTKAATMQDCTWQKYQYILISGSSERYMSLGKEIKDIFCCQTSPHSTRPNSYLEQNWVVLWLCWPKMQLCRIIHCKNTSKMTWLVHHKGAWVLGGESRTYLLPNLNIT